MEAILGTWRLISFEVQVNDRRRMSPYGEDVGGLLIYERSGYMSEIISGNRVSHTAILDVNLMPDDEKLAIAKNFIANSGKFEIQGKTIIHHIEVSFLPSLVGTSQERAYRIVDEQLIVEMSPVVLGDKSFVAEFVWGKLL